MVANLLDAPHRFTRDIDLLRRRGPPEPEELRRRFREVIAIQLDDGMSFKADGVRAVVATRDDDGYDGVKISIRAFIAQLEVNLKLDVGFGDAVVPPVEARMPAPFLPDDDAARVHAYLAPPVVSEKVQTLLAKFPAIRHRLKDLLDIVTMAQSIDFDGRELCASLSATMARRQAPIDLEVLDDMHEVFVGKEWQRDWAAMLKDKSATDTPDLAESLRRLDNFVRPVLMALVENSSTGRWEAGGPWRPDETP